jgi:hypothetical protein
MIAENYRHQVVDWAKTRPWIRILLEAMLLLLFVLSSTRLLRH